MFRIENELVGLEMVLRAQEYVVRVVEGHGCEMYPPVSWLCLPMFSCACGSLWLFFLLPPVLYAASVRLMYFCI